VIKEAARQCSTVAELCHTLAEQIPESREREAFLKSSLGTTTAPSTNKSTSPVTTSGTQGWDAAWLARVEQALAAYIGPIAKVMVKRAAKTAATPEELCRALSGEISSEADRKRFLSAVSR
jgi:serine/threonine-protein kinase